ncbi:hypothetical protein DP57_5943 [Burkholderia pseudomallei]|uniref:hypothetical protein n=1 Tax=Burkholderia pseudomallei TaxID=28450 RepID=UPI00050F8072|nr:hypothetical protein [Burkholderia pseudomallei]KGC70185.1 hypothetical protein DP57_5943 [Burkholderia pseudomallei]
MNTLATKLTSAQARLMRSFDSADDLNALTQWLCSPDEWRVTRGCAAKGLLVVHGMPGPGAHFKIQPTARGVDVARAELMRSTTVPIV